MKIFLLKIVPHKKFYVDLNIVSQFKLKKNIISVIFLAFCSLFVLEINLFGTEISELLSLFCVLSKTLWGIVPRLSWKNRTSWPWQKVFRTSIEMSALKLSLVPIKIDQVKLKFLERRYDLYQGILKICQLIITWRRSAIQKIQFPISTSGII